jgi:hypothetical protein
MTMVRLVALMTALTAACLAGCAAPSAPLATATWDSGIDVILLVGQSNMSGRGGGADDAAELMADPRILAWDPRQAGAERLARAADPLPHQDIGHKPVAAGPGISFARAYLTGLPLGRRVLLVPAALGGTGFNDAAGSWRVTSTPVSPLTTEAVARANAAMRELGPRARFAGILWHQGETDGGTALPGPAYAAELTALIAYFRSHIDGAGPSTPFVVGQYVPSHLLRQTGNPRSTLDAITEVNYLLPTRLAHTACVSSAGLSGNPAPDDVHFDAASQRDMGRRYAAKFIEAQRNAQPGAVVPAC